MTAAATAPLPWSQRLGYLLERVGAAKAAPLKACVHSNAWDFAVLQPHAPRDDAARDAGLKLNVNSVAEPDL